MKSFMKSFMNRNKGFNYDDKIWKIIIGQMYFTNETYDIQRIVYGYFTDGITIDKSILFNAIVSYVYEIKNVNEGYFVLGYKDPSCESARVRYYFIHIFYEGRFIGDKNSPKTICWK